MTRTPCGLRSHGRMALAAAAGGLLLSGLTGCGVAEPEVQPGVAARVDGTVVTTDQVDDTVDGLCSYFGDAGQVPEVPRVTVRNTVLTVLVQEAAASTLVDESGATLADDYRTQLAEAEAADAGGDLPDDQVEALDRIQGAQLYVGYAADAVGGTLLEDEAGAASDDPNQAQTRGQQAIAEFLGQRPLDLNPTYGLTLGDDGQFSADDGLSVAVSDDAVAAQSVAGLTLADGDQLSTAAEGLPASQLC